MLNNFLGFNNCTVGWDCMKSAGLIHKQTSFPQTLERERESKSSRAGQSNERASGMANGPVP